MSELPELPTEVVSYIASFVPIIINSQSRPLCQKTINKNKRRRASKLDRCLRLYYVDEYEDYDRARYEGIFPRLDVETVEFSCILERLKETLRNISEMILSECSNWSRFGMIEYEPYHFTSIVENNFLELVSPSIWVKLDILEIKQNNYLVYALL